MTDFTEAQRRTLATLADGLWHRGGRTSNPDAGTVLGVPALALCRMGLVERRGESRGPKPTASGFEYRLTPAGHRALEHDDDAAFLIGWAAPIVAVAMIALHGWAGRLHTDGSLELRRRVDLGPCPECEQDLARLLTADRIRR